MHVETRAGLSVEPPLRVPMHTMTVPLARTARLLAHRACIASSSRLAPAVAARPAWAPSPARPYAKKSKKASSSRHDDAADDDSTMVIQTKGKQLRKGTSFASGSSRSRSAGEEPVEASESAVEEVEGGLRDKAGARMDKAVERFQGMAYDGVERGKGRVTPGERGVNGKRARELTKPPRAPLSPARLGARPGRTGRAARAHPERSERHRAECHALCRGV